MAINIIITIAGFIALIKCADLFVDGAASFAGNMRIPTVIIGLTVVSFGTSAPELAVSFSAHISGNVDIMYGNVIGSNIINILMVLGAASLIVPINIKGDVIKKEIPILLMMSVGFSVLFLDELFDTKQINTLSRADGIILMLLFSVFVFYIISIIKKSRSDSRKSIENEKPKYNTFLSLILFAIGLAGVIFSSNLIVGNASALAEKIGISQKIISVTIVAIGTSLPELVTTVTAAKKGETDIAIGNIVGSNIFNICIVLGLPVIIMGDAVSPSYNTIDIAFLILPVLALWGFSATGKVIKKYEGALLLLIYFAYSGYVFI
jgi:cation:H+ antiporter